MSPTRSKRVIIKSELTRRIKLSCEEKYFIETKLELKNKLIKRGFSEKIILDDFNLVEWKDRDFLIAKTLKRIEIIKHFGVMLG